MNKSEIEYREYNCLQDVKNTIDTNQDRIEKEMKDFGSLLSGTASLTLASLGESNSLNKTRNPFATHVEDFITHLIFDTLVHNGKYSYSNQLNKSDICIESDDAILQIDVKTTNSSNESDFKRNIRAGPNQVSYHMERPLKVDVNGNQKKIQTDRFNITPNLTPKSNGKVVVTLFIQVVYETYAEAIEQESDKYNIVSDILASEIKNSVVDYENYGHQTIRSASDKLTDEQNKKEQYVKNLYREIYVQQNTDIIDELSCSQSEKEKLYQFNDSLRTISKELLNGLPLYISTILVPNGGLEPDYDDEFTHGKNWGNSYRYEAWTSEFKNLQNQLRTQLPYINEERVDLIEKLLPSTTPQLKDTPISHQRKLAV